MVLNQLLRPLFENLSSDPAPTKSRFYYNTTSNKVRFHNGSEWVFFIDSTDPRLSDRRDPKAHVLATESGLGPEHTVSGASVGAVLRAISSSNAKFEKLSHSDLLDKGANSHSDIDAHLQDITKHFLIIILKKKAISYMKLLLLRKAESWQEIHFLNLQQN